MPEHDRALVMVELENYGQSGEEATRSVVYRYKIPDTTSIFVQKHPTRWVLTWEETWPVIRKKEEN